MGFAARRPATAGKRPAGLAFLLGTVAALLSAGAWAGGSPAAADAGTPAEPTSLRALEFSLLPAEVQAAARALAAKSPCGPAFTYDQTVVESAGPPPAGTPAFVQPIRKGRFQVLPPGRLRGEGPTRMGAEDVHALVVINPDWLWIEVRTPDATQVTKVYKIDTALFKAFHMGSFPSFSLRADERLADMASLVAFDAVRDDTLDGEPCKVFSGKPKRRGRRGLDGKWIEYTEYYYLLIGMIAPAPARWEATQGALCDRASVPRLWCAPRDDGPRTSAKKAERGEQEPTPTLADMPSRTREDVWFSARDGLLRRFQRFDAGGELVSDTRISAVDAQTAVPADRFEYAPPEGAPVMTLFDMMKEANPDFSEEDRANLEKSLEFLKQLDGNRTPPP